MPEDGIKGNLLHKAIDLLLYSHFFIAICAASLTYQVFYIFDKFRWEEPLPIFIFFATLLVYSLHRIIGFTKLDRTIPNRRVSVILKFQNHILIYTGLAFIGMVTMALFLPVNTLILLGIPAILSSIYILPVFGQRRRFRDLDYAKVFVVAMVWVWVCICIPLIQMDVEKVLTTFLLIFEKLFFIIAITVPFDIRDLEIDSSHKIKTIPGSIGVKRSKQLSTLLLICSLFLVIILEQHAFYSFRYCVALVISYLVTIAVVALINQRSHDYWYSCVLDGMILLQFILLLCS
ncbi:MAG: UbiA family prenyltransferase [Saprospiraceae bacterium]|nr:UbiA family prenyltransferase [Saprospiraceae bacterium]